jgi:hypothetical protein
LVRRSSAASLLRGSDAFGSRNRNCHMISQFGESTTKGE